MLLFITANTIASVISVSMSMSIVFCISSVIVLLCFLFFLRVA